MSDRDQDLVRSLGIPVAQVADAISKSRQTVNRGIQSAADYLKPADLARALEFWKRGGSPVYGLAREAICRLYPEAARSVLSGLDDLEEINFSPDLPGEYWLISGDFIAFRSLSICSEQFEALCRSENAEVRIFVNKGDCKQVFRFAKKYEENDNIQVIECKTDLRLLPNILLRMDDENQISLFGVSETGFVPLSRQEGIRLRAAFQDAEINTLESVDAD